MRTQSLRTRLVAGISVLILLTIALYSVISVGMVKREVQRRHDERLGFAMREALLELELQARTQAIRAEFFAKSPDLVSAVRSRAHHGVLSVLERIDGFLGKDVLMAVDTEGELLASVLRQGQEGESLVPAAFHAPLRAGEAHESILVNGTALHAIALHPVRDGDRTLGAVMVGKTIGHAFLKRLEEHHGVQGMVLAGGKIQAATLTDEGLLRSSQRQLKERLQGGTIEIDSAGAPTLCTGAELGAGDGFLVLGLSTADRSVVLMDVVQALGLAGAVLALLGFAASFWVAGRIVNPVRCLGKLTREIAAGSLDKEAPTELSGEIGELARDFNRMTAALRISTTSIDNLNQEIAERLRVESERDAFQIQLSQSQKMEALGLLAGGVAHDFNNLLLVIGGHAEMTLIALGEDDPRAEDLGIILDAVHRAAALTRQLLGFSRKQAVAEEVLDLELVMKGLDDLLGRLLGETVQLRSDVEKGTWTIYSDLSQFEQVIANLVVNARDAMPNGGQLRIGVSNLVLPQETAWGPDHAPAGEYVSICIRDTGIGMAKDVIEHIFEPFFSTKAERHGTGLGLSTSYGNVRRAEAFIAVESKPGVGTEFRLIYPRCQAQAHPTEAGAAAPLTDGGGQSILLVDDEDGVRRVTSLVLNEFGYTVLTAESAEGALQILSELDTAPDLLISDQVMPGMSGQQLAEAVQRDYGPLPVILMSGYAHDRRQAEDTTWRGAFLQKPFRPHALIELVKVTLDANHKSGSP